MIWRRCFWLREHVFPDYKELFHGVIPVAITPPAGQIGMASVKVELQSFLASAGHRRRSDGG
jgi:hypothetical protein